MVYLDFEENLKQCSENLELAKIRNIPSELEKAQSEFDSEVSKTYSNISDYQKLQLARHIDRPYALDYIRLMMDEKYEIHGDRHFRDDPAILCYIGRIDGKRCVVIGEQKGRGTKNKLKRNFGMPHPEGYRKALRAAKLAEKFNLPVLMLIDTPGAYPGIGAEERGQSEAIAVNLFELSDINTITVSVVIGEGGSGGALAIGVADRLAMLEYSVFSVISPEGCAAILWDDPKEVETAATALKILPNYLKEHGLIDDVIKEPAVCAHRDKKAAAKSIKEYFLNTVNELEKLSSEERLDKRYKRILDLGKFAE
ncbi:MAG: acetyl-CoA carboxylase carboxyl transferase subunit alpha [Campylobacterales bacterium]|nr:acetyl-CoA carboxylase carboxyl transferase subunit alpha [Campylobacterales bacterium]